MVTHRKSLAVALAAGVVVISITWGLHLATGGRTGDVTEEAKRSAETVADELRPVVEWKLRMLRAMGF